MGLTVGSGTPPHRRLVSGSDRYIRVISCSSDYDSGDDRRERSSPSTSRSPTPNRHRSNAHDSTHPRKAHASTAEHDRSHDTNHPTSSLTRGAHSHSPSSRPRCCTHQPADPSHRERPSLSPARRHRSLTLASMDRAPHCKWHPARLHTNGAVLILPQDGATNSDLSSPTLHLRIITQTSSSVPGHLSPLDDMTGSPNILPDPASLSMTPPTDVRLGPFLPQWTAITSDNLVLTIIHEGYAIEFDQWPPLGRVITTPPSHALCDEDGDSSPSRAHPNHLGGSIVAEAALVPNTEGHVNGLYSPATGTPICCHRMPVAFYIRIYSPCI
ncbi:hypothetical protein JRQ81_009675 [Phrynocephalus forsythii]|uniref:Uncharacterized protein n=1 Tax=Phrynocephalus forsythii TaxID=171643 RepID=A0A9Q0Y572_9SAUR|nr:hypothetical protein JRQ81_009675 [Phrynocephalus forsythii]